MTRNVNTINMAGVLANHSEDFPSESILADPDRLNRLGLSAIEG